MTVYSYVPCRCNRTTLTRGYQLCAHCGGEGWVLRAVMTDAERTAEVAAGEAPGQQIAIAECNEHA